MYLWLAPFSDAVPAAGQAVFGFFAVAFTREFYPSCIRKWIFLVLDLYQNLTVPIELTSIGGFFMLLGLGGYVYTTIPSIKSMREELFAMQGLILATAVFQLFSIFVDYQLGVMIWASIATPLIALFAWVSFRAWREGDSFARWVFMAFVVLSVALALRTPALYSYFPENWVDIVLAPISMLGVVSLVLVGLFEQMRALERQLMSANLATNAQIDFLSRMSHELRTPLDSVLGNAQLLMRGSDRLQKAPELIGMVNNGRHLLRLIDEILDYARGTAGALKLRSEPVRLEAYLHEIESTAQILAARNGNTFELVDRGSTSNLREWVLEFDAGRLRQVLDNLIVNAARHTRGGTITLEYGLSTTRDGHRQLSFAVSDTGEGIPAADRERIFLPFERVGRAEQYGGKGAGMGLAIARQLVELMGGRLTVESTPGSGSTFRFFISVALSDASEIIETDTAPSPLEARGYAGRPRIALVIDDDPGGRSIFSGLLTRAGFEVREADTGNAGVAIARQCEVLDVVVTDQFMPDGDGWLVLETLSRLRPEVPVVMVSAAPGSAPERFPTELRFAHEFLKPVDHRMFLTVIGQLLGLRWTLSPPVARGLDTPADLRPNREELLALREMVELGEITAIREWARSLRLRTPQFSGFADRVEAAVADLDLDLLETLAREPAPV